MAARNHKIRTFLTPGKKVHLVGIGGVSMRPLGLVLQGMGIQVTGSDMNASVSTDELIAKGIEVHIGHRAENIQGADCIIRTAAAHNDNPEVAAARAQGIPVFERAQAWGVIMREYKNAICVSGTHGKTTTTGMLTHIFMQAQRDLEKIKADLSAPREDKRPAPEPDDEDEDLFGDTPVTTARMPRATAQTEAPAPIPAQAETVHRRRRQPRLQVIQGEQAK